MSAHGKQTPAKGIHAIVAYEFANNTDLTNFANELNGRTAPVADDVHKVGYDGANYFVLLNHSPVTWTQIDAGGTSNDPDAIHDNLAGEILLVDEKTNPVGTDLILIEDSADANNKKRVQIGNLPAPTVTDTDAIHDNVAGEIAAITEKGTPVGSDIILIEDSEAGNVKKRVLVSNIPVQSHAIGGTAHSSSTLASLNSLITDATLDDANATRIPTVHALGGGRHSSSTLASLNALISDATLDDAGDNRTDADAIHDNVAGEIVAITEKSVPDDDDVVIIEDSAAGNVKKRVKIVNLPGGAGAGDADAIHDNVAGEIALITEKVTPASADLLIIEDSAAANAKKRLQVGNVPNQVHALGSADHSSDTLANLNAKISDATLDDSSASRPPTIHAIGGSEHSSSTLAQLNALISDATLDDSSANRTDADAIHDNVGGEINAITEKGSPIATDLIIIEDSAASNSKKKVQIGNLPGFGGSDTDAIHDNVAGEIAAVASKGSPVSADLLLIEDSADSNNKKRVTIGSLPGFGGTDADAVHVNVASEISGVTLKGSPTTSDLLLIEDVADSNNKKRITIGTLPTGSDPDAIHDNVAGEIAAITLKGTPVNADLLLIEDSADTNNKKRITVGSIPTQVHASTHLPSGSDPLTTAVAGAITIGASAAEGSAESFSRSDHTHSLAAPAAPQDVTRTAAATGSSNVPARADHKHDIAVATPDSLTVGGTNVEGTSSNVARSDHKHGLPAFGTTSGTFCVGNDARLSDNRTDADAIHDNVASEILSITEKVTPVGADLLLIEDSAGAAWTKKRITIANLPLGNHAATHLPSGTDPLTTAAAGAITIGASAAEGSAESFSRSDHVHSLAAPAAPVNITKAPAATGVANEAARADHKHNVNTAAGVGNPPGTASAEGVSTSLARADHTHALAAFGTTSGTFCEGNDARLSDTRTDADAIHDNVAGEIVALTDIGAPAAADVILIEDASDLHNKKRFQWGNVLITESQISDLDHEDPTAVHTDNNNEINALAQKLSPISADILIIEDSDGGTWNKKRVTIGSLPGFGGSDNEAIHDNVANEIAPISLKNPVVPGDILLIEDSDAGNVKKHITVAGLRITESQVTDLDHTDSDAYHSNVSAEISTTPLKATPVVADVMLIEDSEDTFAKKRVTISTIPAVDPNAYHDDTPSEISGTALKATPVGGDLLLIEDSEDVNNKKRITVSTLPVTESQITDLDHTDTDAYHSNVAGEIAGTPLKSTLVSADLFVIEDSAAADAKKRAPVSAIRITESQITDLDHTDPDAVHVDVSGEIVTVTEKTTPVSGDWLLIEDSENLNVKKRLQIGNLPGSVANVFGDERQFAVANSATTTTGPTFVNKVTFTTGTLAGGEYKVEWYCELKNVTSGVGNMKVEIDDTTIVADAQISEQASDFIAISGFDIRTLSNAAHTVDLDYNNLTAARDTTIRNARISIYRWT